MEYLQLTKPRSVLLLLVTALAGMALATPGLPPLSIVVFTVVGGAMAAGGANALNCYLDRDIDARTKYTAHRPLPSGALSPRQALFFGVVLCVAATTVLGFGVNWLSAELALVGALYYVVVYTMWLKRISVWNIVVGGVAGAFPVLVGWVAVTGTVSAWALWLGAIVVLWTPPHTWALALVRRRDYELAGIPMLPVARGDEEARRQILAYAVLLLLVTLLPAAAGFLDLGFLTAALLLGGSLVMRALQLLREASNRAAWQLYRYSITYLGFLFAVMILDHTMRWVLRG